MADVPHDHAAAAAAGARARAGRHRVGSFQVFDTIQIATAGIGGGNPGGPGNSSRVLYMYIFQQAFEFNALGYASALAVALIVLLVIVAAFQLRLLRAGESDLA